MLGLGENFGLGRFCVLRFAVEFPAKKCLTECDFVLRLVTKLLNGSFKHLLILSIDFDLKVKETQQLSM